MSVRRRDSTDRLPPATPAGELGTPGAPLLMIDEVTAELRVFRAAFYR